MVAFYTNRPRLLAWIKTLEILYYNNLGEEEKLNIVWQDEPNRWTDPDSATNMIVIALHSNMCSTDENSLQYQLRFFITTGTIQVQGNNVSRFISEHFPKLKALVKISLGEADQVCSKVHLEQQASDDEEETQPKTVYSEETQPKTICSEETQPKIVYPKETHPEIEDSEETKSDSVEVNVSPTIKEVDNLKLDVHENPVDMIGANPSDDEDSEIQININLIESRTGENAEHEESNQPHKFKLLTEEKDFKKLKGKLDDQEKMNEKIQIKLKVNAARPQNCDVIYNS